MIQCISNGDWEKILSILKVSEDKTNSFKFTDIY